ncbi:MAG: helix-turn-helix transcriptional regulator [Coriobacteriales bacterium]|nr:helix-turn-helix transcriptional regulator [Coriobacteriales bacterium]
MGYIAKTSAILTAVFFFLVTLLFDAPSVGTLVSGIAGSSPAPAILVCIIAMAMLELVGMIAKPLPHAWVVRIPAFASVLLPILAAVILVFWSDIDPPFMVPSLRPVPTLAIAILGMCVVALVGCLSRDDPPDSQGLFLASGIAVVLAVLALDAAFALFEDASHKLLAVAVVMTTAGIVAAYDRLSRAAMSKANEKRSEDDSVPGTDQDVPSWPASRIATLIAPLVLTTVFCAFELGQAWQEGLFAELSSHQPLLLAVIALGLTVTGIVYVSWRHTRSIDSFLAGLTFLLVLPILVAIFEDVLPNVWIAGILMFSQILYLLFSWTSIVLIGRLFSVGDAVMPVFAIVLLTLYTLFMAGPHIDDIALVSCFVNSVSLGFLVCLLVYFFRKANQQDANNTGQVKVLGMDQALQRRCDEIARAHGLSPRESELLPMLAVGLSAGVIGKRAFISEHTVKTHRYRIYQKLGVASHEELVEMLGICS